MIGEAVVLPQRGLHVGRLVQTLLRHGLCSGAVALGPADLLVVPGGEAGHGRGAVGVRVDHGVLLALQDGRQPARAPGLLGAGVRGARPDLEVAA